MSYPYFFVNAGSIEGNRIKIGGEDLNHLINVLRSKAGDTVYISDNAGYKYKTEIIDIKKSDVILLIKDKRKIAKIIPQITLYQCILKKNSMEFVIQKSTEIGVDRIIPVISGRVVIDKRKIAGKVDRWQKISNRASKQSRRDFKCEILTPEDINSIKVSDYDLFYVPYEEGSGNGGGLAEVRKVSRIGYIIGPEGGFETGELNFLKDSGAREIRFGKNIYRSETAAIYFLSVLDYLTGNQK
ncbi:MAG: 16S rRNA (uracil(1498)-N(3))-methyltransferase [Actinobacteria bacterium]|nr:MAG: 16S rRNA (uracil(1498)-N(3))-methyltransferase [Actinomycetota bacterium]